MSCNPCNHISTSLRTLHSLTHWGRMTHICVSKLTIIGSDNGLSPDRRQAIFSTHDGVLLVGPLGTYFSEIFIVILIFSFIKMCSKVSSAKWQPFCLGLNVLIQLPFYRHLPCVWYHRQLFTFVCNHLFSLEFGPYIQRCFGAHCDSYIHMEKSGSVIRGYFAGRNNDNKNPTP